MTRSTAALYALVALGAVVALLFAAWAHLRFWSRRLGLALEYASAEVLPTPDGAAVELRRAPIPVGVARAELPPVLLVHGVGANHRNQDLDADHSLARYLAARGRDVWLLTLRSGLRLRTRAARRRVRFGAMVLHDLPIGVGAVLERTGAVALDYVGFSMGGMLLYAALGRTVPEASVRRAVIVGSPGFVHASRWLRPLLRLVPRALVPGLPLRLGAMLVAFASEWLPTPMHAMVYNRRNVSKGITRAALANLVEDMPGPLNADFLEWAAAGGDLRAGDALALPGLAKIATPALFIAGAGDRVAPVASVQRAFEAWGKELPAAAKRFVIVGREHGEREDYGHGDLAIGANAATELYAPIAVFLAA